METTIFNGLFRDSEVPANSDTRSEPHNLRAGTGSVGIVPRDDQNVNVPDITVVASTDVSTRAAFRSVSAATCISQPG